MKSKDGGRIVAEAGADEAEAFAQLGWRQLVKVGQCEHVERRKHGGQSVIALRGALGRHLPRVSARVEVFAERECLVEASMGVVYKA